MQFKVDCALVLQEELALTTRKHEQVSASEAQARQQLGEVSQGYQQAAAAASSAEEEVQRLSMALQCSEAQLAEALQKESQVSNTSCKTACCKKQGSSSGNIGGKDSSAYSLGGHEKEAPQELESCQDFGGHLMCATISGPMCNSSQKPRLLA